MSALRCVLGLLGAACAVSACNGGLDFSGGGGPFGPIPASGAKDAGAADGGAEDGGHFDGGLAPDGAARFLAAHNAARAAATPAPSPALPALAWSEQLAQVAAQWAGNCSFTHNPLSGAWGESLDATALDATSLPEAVVQRWVAERTNYDFAANTCAPLARCREYLQVVWRNTTQAGCAQAVCRSTPPFGGTGPWALSVCNYYAPGAISGQRPY